MSHHNDKIADGLKSLSLSQVEALDRNALNGKARDYYENSQITSATVFRNRISGYVGNYFESHQVEIIFHENEISSSCTCSKARRVCKHMVALLYSWVNEGMDFLNVDEALEQIKEMDREHLIDVITNIIRQNPSSVDLFLAKPNPSWDEIELEPEF